MLARSLSPPQHRTRCGDSSCRYDASVVHEMAFISSACPAVPAFQLLASCMSLVRVVYDYFQEQAHGPGTRHSRAHPPFARAHARTRASGAAAVLARQHSRLLPTGAGEAAWTMRPVAGCRRYSTRPRSRAARHPSHSDPSTRSACEARPGPLSGVGRWSLCLSRHAGPRRVHACWRLPPAL